MKDRKAYWRQYQRERYARQKAARYLEAHPTDFVGPHETVEAMFRRLCRERNLVGQSTWRGRARFKKEFIKSFAKTPMKEQLKLAKVLVNTSKSNARIKNLEFSLESQDLIPLPAVCPVLKIPLQYYVLVDEEFNVDQKPSLDRIDNSKGYTKDNVQVISWRANRLKNDATLNELMLLGEWAASKK